MAQSESVLLMRVKLYEAPRFPSCLNIEHRLVFIISLFILIHACPIFFVILLYLFSPYCK